MNFTAGFDPDPDAVDTHSPIVPSPMGQQDISTMIIGIPQMLIVGMLNLAAFWFNNRGLLRSGVKRVEDRIDRIESLIIRS